MSPVAEYIKNLGKSVVYATTDYVGQNMPAASEIAESNEELFKDVYHSIRDIRGTMQKTADAIKNTPVYRVGQSAFKNAISDIKTGKLYNKEREDAAFDESFDINDDFDLSTMDDSSGTSSGHTDGGAASAGELSIMKATHDAAKMQSHATVSAIQASTNYMVETSKANANLLYMQTSKMNSTMTKGFKGIVTGIDALYKFNNEVVKTMADNSKKYFETSTQLQRENNALLKEMVEMQRNVYKANQKKDNINDPLFNIMGANGTPNLKEYGKTILKNMKSLANEKTYGMASMFNEDMLKMMAANPLAGIPAMMISTMMGPMIKTHMKNLDKTIGGMFGSFISKMNYTASKNSFGGSLGKEILGKIFGVQLDTKDSIDTSNAKHHGPTAFDWSTKRSIVEVIPSYLARIESALTGQPARVYDDKNGKWTTMSALKSKFKKDRRQTIERGASEELAEMRTIMAEMKRTQAINDAQAKRMEKVIKHVNNQRYNDGGWYDRSGSMTERAARYGLSENEMRAYDTIWKNVSRGTRANTPGSIMRSKMEYSKKLQEAEDSGDSILRLLFNGFDPKHSMSNDRQSLNGKKGSGNTILTDNLLGIKDKYGMSIHDYLHEIALNTSRPDDYRPTTGRSRVYELQLRDLERRRQNGMRGGARNHDRSIRMAKGRSEAQNSRDINALNIDQEKIMAAAGTVNETRRRKELKENETWIRSLLKDTVDDKIDEMRSNNASPEEIRQYRESMKKIVNAASEGSRFSAMADQIRKLTEKPVGVLSGVIEKADEHIFNSLFEDEDRKDKDITGKPAKGLFGKLKNRLDELFAKINEKIDIQEKDREAEKKSTVDKANEILKQLTGHDIVGNAKHFGNIAKTSAINSVKAAGSEVLNSMKYVKNDLKAQYDKIPTHADGARNITQSGLAILSKGERVIPADRNPFNPDRGKVSRETNRRDEKAIKRKIIEQVKNADMYADGTPDQPGIWSQFFSTVSGGKGATKGEKKAIKLTQKEVEKHLPNIAGGGAVGAIVGTATGLGGPLLGAVAGAAVSIASNSEAFQKKLFGERIYDSVTGKDTGNRKGGLFSKETQDVMKKYMPDMKNYGITGSVLGLVTPLGPIGGLLMGSAIGFAKNNQTARNMLFGEQGLIGEDAQKAIKKAFPATSKTAIAGLLAGAATGIGLLPGAVVGAGLGLVSTTDEFKDFLLGTPDSNGKRTGGVAGAIHDGLVKPLKDLGTSIKDNFTDWFKDKMVKPVASAMAPIGKQVQLGVKDMLGLATSIFKKASQSKTGISLFNHLKNSKLGRGVKWLAGKSSYAAKGAKKLIEAPSYLIGQAGDKLRRHQIKKGNADYMTARERLKFMGDDNYDLRDLDEAMEGSTKEDLDKFRMIFGQLEEGKNFLDAEESKQLSKVGNHVSDVVKDHGRATRIMKAIRSGNVEDAVKYIEQAKISAADKRKLQEFINDEGANLREITAKKENYKADRQGMFKQLQKAGFKKIGENNFDKYANLFKHEYKRRDAEMKANSDAIDPDDPASVQAAMINEQLKEGFGEQVNLLTDISNTLKAIAGAGGRLTSGQQAVLDNIEDRNMNAEAKATGDRMDAAKRRSSELEKAFGSKVNLEHQEGLLDIDKDEWNDIISIGQAGYKGQDINEILQLKGKARQRWFQLAKAGYAITNKKAIQGLSNKDFDKLMILAEAHVPITNLSAIKKTSVEECQLMAQAFVNGMATSQGGLQQFARTGHGMSPKSKEFGKRVAMLNSMNAGKSSAEVLGLDRQEGIEIYGAGTNDLREVTHKYRNDISMGHRMEYKAEKAATKIAHGAKAIGNGVVNHYRDKYTNMINDAKYAITGTNAGLSKGTGVVDKIVADHKHKNLKPGNSNALAIATMADGGLVTKDNQATVLSKGELVIGKDKKDESDKQDKSTPIKPIDPHKAESEINKATRNIKAEERKSKKSTKANTVNTEYGPQEYKLAADGSMVLPKTKGNVLIQKKIADRDATQKELVANIKELVAVNKESLKANLAGAGKKAKKGIWDTLKDLAAFLNPLNLLKKLGGLFTSFLGPLAPIVGKLGSALLPAAGWLGGKALDFAKWGGGKIWDLAKLGGGKLWDKTEGIRNKIKNSKFGQKVGKGLDKVANSKVGKFGGKVWNKIKGVVGGSSDDSADIDTTEPQDELEAVHIHGSNIEKLLQEILNTIKNGDSSIADNGSDLGDAVDRIGGGNGKKGTSGEPNKKGEASTKGGKSGKRKWLGRAGKALGVAGLALTAKSVYDHMSGEDGENGNPENGGGGGSFGGMFSNITGQDALAAGLDAASMGLQAHDVYSAYKSMKDGTEVAGNMGKAGEAIKAANAAGDVREVAGVADAANPSIMQQAGQKIEDSKAAIAENTKTLVSKVESGFKNVISNVSKFTGGDIAEKLYKFKDFIIKKITTPACVKKIMARAAKHAAGYAAAGTGIGAVITIGMEVAFAASAFYDGYNRAPELLKIPNGTESTGMKLCCGFVSSVLQAIPVIGWVLDPEDVMDSAVKVVGKAFGFSEEDLQRLREGGKKEVQQTNSFMQGMQKTIEKAKGLASGAWDKVKGYGSDLITAGKKAVGSAWDKLSSYGSNMYKGLKNLGSKAWNGISNLGSKVWNGASNMASSMWQGMQSIGSTIADKVSSGAQYVSDGLSSMKDAAADKLNSMKKFVGLGKWGRHKWGRGSSEYESDAMNTFHSQIDPVNSMAYNAAGDTGYQDMADSGCGPASAANMASALGVHMDTKAAAQYALDNGYKEKDGGTKPGFFKDYLGKAGISTKDISSHNDIRSQLEQGNPVLLMGTDKSNTPAKEAAGTSTTPYGTNPHYVVATGIDGDDITIQDPESDTPNAHYNASKVLNNSSLAMAAGYGRWGKGGIDSVSRENPIKKITEQMSGLDKKKKKKMWGRAKEAFTRSLIRRRRQYGRSRWGRGDAIDEDPPFATVANTLAGLCGSQHPEFFWAQMMHETGGPDMERQWMEKHPEYGNIHNYGGFTWYDGMGENYKGPPRPANEGGFYAKFDSDEEYAQMAFDKVYKSYASELATAETPEDFARILKSHGYYAGAESEYAASMAALLNGQYKDKLGNLKAGAPGPGNKKGGTKNGGVFGDLANIATTLQSGFSLPTKKKDAPKKTTPKPPSNKKTPPSGSKKPNELVQQLKSGDTSVESFIQLTSKDPDVSRDDIKSALEEAGMWDEDTQSYYNRYFGDWDKAKSDDTYCKLLDQYRAGQLNAKEFIEQADKTCAPRAMIYCTLKTATDYDGNNMWESSDQQAYDEYYNAKDGTGKWGRGRSRWGRVKNLLGKVKKNEKAFRQKIESQKRAVKYGNGRWGRAKNVMKKIMGANKPKSIHSQNPTIKAFNEYALGRGGKVNWGGARWGMGSAGEDIYQGLIDRGFTENAAAGILGNIMQESTCDPTATNPNGYHGLVQWDPDSRWPAAKAWIESQGKDPDSIDGQLDYIAYEAPQRYDSMNKVNAASSPEEAARAWLKWFEGAEGQEDEKRVQYANQAAQTKGAGMGGASKGNGNKNTKSGKKGIFAKYQKIADAMAKKMQSALAPAAKAVTSGAEKMFGKDTLSTIFGDENPFNSIFSGGEEGGGGNAPSGGGGATDEGIQKASAYAQTRVGTEGYGNNGCTTWCKVYLEHAGHPFASEMSLYVPTLMEQAKSKGMWKEADQPGAEGDIALLETIGTRDDGPDHAVIYDGKGGCWGNSSGKNQILHYDNMLSSFPRGLWGYVATGSGDGSVANKEGSGQSDAEAQRDSTLDVGAGKWGRGGRKRPLRYGKGLLNKLFGKKKKKKATRRDPKKELAMQGQLAKKGSGNSIYDAFKTKQEDKDHGIKNMKDVATYIQNIPKNTMKKENIISAKDSFDTARKKAIAAKADYQAQVSKNPALDPTIKGNRDIANDVPKTQLDKVLRGSAKSDPQIGFSGTDNITSLDDAREYIKNVPEDSIPEYNRIKPDDSISVARAKALKIKENAKNQNTINSMGAANPGIIPSYNKIDPENDSLMVVEAKVKKNRELTEAAANTGSGKWGKGRWGRGANNWLSTINSTMGDLSTSIFTSYGLFGQVNNNVPETEAQKAENVKKQQEQLDKDLAYLTNKGYDKAEAIEFLNRDPFYGGNIGKDGKIIVEKVLTKDEQLTNDIKYLTDKGYSKEDAIKLLNSDSYDNRITTEGKLGGQNGAYTIDTTGNYDSSGRQSDNQIANDIKYLTDKGYSKEDAIKLLNQSEYSTHQLDKDGKYKVIHGKKWGTGHHHRHRHNPVTDIAPAKPSFKDRLDAILHPYKRFGDDHGLKTMQDCLDYIKDVPQEQIPEYNRILPTDSIDVARAKAIKIRENYDKGAQGKFGRGIGSWFKKIGGTIGDFATNVWHGLQGLSEKDAKAANKAPTAELEQLKAKQDKLDNDIQYLVAQGYTKKQAIDYLNSQPDYNGMIEDNGKLKLVKKLSKEEQLANDIKYLTDNGYSKAQAIAVLNADKAYGGTIAEDGTLKAKAAQGKWGMGHHHRHRAKPSVIATPSKPSFKDRLDAILHPYKRFGDDHGLKTMQDCLDYIKDVPQEQIPEYNRILPTDSIDVARAKAIKIRENYDKGAQGKWGRGIGSWFKKIGGTIGDFATNVWHGLQGLSEQDAKAANKAPTAELEKLRAKQDKLDNDIQYLVAQGYTKKQAIEYLNSQPDYNGMIEDNGKLKLVKKLSKEEQLKNDIQYLTDNGYSKEQAIAVLNADKAYGGTIAEDGTLKAKAAQGKWGMGHHRRRTKPSAIPAPTKPSFKDRLDAILHPYKRFGDDHGLKTMQDCLDYIKDVPQEQIPEYNRILPTDSIDVARAKAIKIRENYDKGGKGKYGRGIGSWFKKIGGTIGDFATNVWHGLQGLSEKDAKTTDKAPTAELEKLRAKQDKLDNDIQYLVAQGYTKKQAIDYLNTQPDYNGMIEDNGKLKLIKKLSKEEQLANDIKYLTDNGYSKAQAIAVLNADKAYGGTIGEDGTLRGKAAQGKWGMGHHHRRRSRYNAMAQATPSKPSFKDRLDAILHPYKRFGDDHGLTTMQDCLDYIKDVPQDQIPEYNRIDPVNDSITVARAKAIKIRENYDKGAQGKWGRGIKERIDAILHPYKRFGDDHGIKTMADALNYIKGVPESEIPEYNKIDPSKDSIDVARAKAIAIVENYEKKKKRDSIVNPETPASIHKKHKERKHRKHSNKAATEQVESKGNIKDRIDNILHPYKRFGDDHGIYSIADARRYISDVPEDFIPEYNKILDTDDITVARAKAIKIRQSYDAELKKKGISPIESKTAAQTIDPNNPTDTNTTDKNATKTAEQNNIPLPEKEKREEKRKKKAKEEKAKQAAQNSQTPAQSSSSSIPTTTEQDRKNNQTTEKSSVPQKPASTTTTDNGKTTIINNGSNGEYNNKFDTMISLLSSIANSLSALSGTTAPKVDNSLQASTDMKRGLNAKAANQVNQQMLQQSFSSIANAMNELAKS